VRGLELLLGESVTHIEIVSTQRYLNRLGWRRINSCRAASGEMISRYGSEVEAAVDREP